MYLFYIHVYNTKDNRLFYLPVIASSIEHAVKAAQHFGIVYLGE